MGKGGKNVNPIKILGRKCAIPKTDSNNQDPPKFAELNKPPPPLKNHNSSLFPAFFSAIFSKFPKNTKHFLTPSPNPQKYLPNKI